MRITTIFSLLGMLAASTTVASAQCNDLPPIGTIYHCIIVSGGKILVVNGSDEAVNSEAAATFEVSEYTSNPCGVVLSERGFSSKSFSLTLGEFTTFTNPGSRSSATITQSIPGSPSLLPASLNISLELSATASAVPGTTFRAFNPLVLESTAPITSLPLSNVEVRQVTGSIGFFPDRPTTIPVGLKEVDVVLSSDGN